MEKRINYSSGTVWENVIGYSRAVKVGNLVEISGTTAIDGMNIIGKGDPYKQAKVIIEKFSSILNKAGGSLNDIIRIRMYVINIKHWEKIGEAFSEYFHDIKPAATLVEVNALIDPGLLVEMEATAIITSD